MNILILSCGTRKKIIEYFRQSIGENGRVIAADCSQLAPALYFADDYYIIPRIESNEYLESILNICRKEKINAVISLIDPELSILAKNKELFEQEKIKLSVSEHDVCEITLNKMKMYNWLKENGFKCAKSYVDIRAFKNDFDKGMIEFPVFVKPVCGSASVEISKIYDLETLELFVRKNECLMIQEFLHGQEIGADCYIDMITGEVISVFLKKKIAMRAGETDKSVSFKNDKLFEMLKCFCNKMEFKGPIDIDIFEIDGEFYISEVNPRFGGGYPHAHECGADHVELLIKNFEGFTNTPQIGQYKENVYMMKYNEIYMREN